jgi:hypothetical protein
MKVTVGELGDKTVAHDKGDARSRLGIRPLTPEEQQADVKAASW